MDYTLAIAFMFLAVSTAVLLGYIIGKNHNKEPKKPKPVGYFSDARYVYNKEGKIIGVKSDFASSTQARYEVVPLGYKFSVTDAEKLYSIDIKAVVARRKHAAFEHMMKLAENMGCVEYTTYRERVTNEVEEIHAVKMLVLRPAVKS